MATNSAPKILLKLDEQGLTWKHKIGVLYCGVNQCSEEDFYNNENGSDAFEEFLGFLGKRINLEGFGGYSGGLDCRGEFFFKNGGGGKLEMGFFYIQWGDA